MFVNHMSGDDDVYWKYVYLARELFTGPEKFSIEKYRTNIQLIYPYRQVCTFFNYVILSLFFFSKKTFMNSWSWKKLPFQRTNLHSKHVLNVYVMSS